MSGSGTFGELARETARRLAEAGIESAHLDARLLLGHLTGLDAAALLARRDDPVELEVIGALRGLTDRRAAHEPMAHILGEREFWSLPLRVTADTLVPRPDTETLVEAALGWRESVPDCREPAVLDLGTGTGCILLALLSEWEDASGVGIDISESALAVAAENAKRLGLAGRARFLVSDWGRGLDARFDVIVSNPPYIPEDEIAGLPPEVAPVRSIRGSLRRSRWARCLSCSGRPTAPPDGAESGGFPGDRMESERRCDKRSPAMRTERPERATRTWPGGRVVWPWGTHHSEAVEKKVLDYSEKTTTLTPQVAFGAPRVCAGERL